MTSSAETESRWSRTSWYTLILTTLSSGVLGIFFLFPGVVNAALLNASSVLGQGGVYTTRTINYPSGTTNALGFKGLTSLTLDRVNHRLFTSESYSASGGTFNDRVLVFQLDANNNITTTTPSYVLGSCDFVTPGTGGLASTTFGGGSVVNIFYDSANSRLFVSSYAQNRVLGFDVAPADIANCEPASFVIGQADFTHGSSATTQNGINGPDNVTYDSTNNRLFVSQFGSNRVTAYSVPPNATSSINGENALFVLGQADFTHGNSTTTQNGMSAPAGLRFDSVNNRLFVDDNTNNRIIAYSVPPNATSSINGENALFVLGQADFTHSGAAVTQNGMSAPDDMDYDSTTNRLIVSDSSNNRILIFVVPSNATSSINGESAQTNLGEADWTSNGSGLARNKYLVPEPGNGYDPVNNILYVYESYGDRVLEIPMISITNASLAGGFIGTSYSQTISTQNGQGTSTSFSVYSGSLPNGLSLNSATGVISGVPTVSTSTSVSIEADDSSATGPFFFRKTFSLNVVDATPPIAVLNSPSGGIVLGTIALMASSTDNVAVAGTQFYVDGTKVGTEVTSTSGQDTYTTSWDTTTVPDGSHSLIAVARDTSNNYATSSSVTITVDNTPAVQGGGGLVVGSGPLAPGYINLQPSIPSATTTSPSISGDISSSSASSSTTTTSLILDTNHQLWDVGNDIYLLQEWLNIHGFVLAYTGAGSPGQETHTFGNLTFRALSKLQAVNGLPASGWLGPLTRALIGRL